MKCIKDRCRERKVERRQITEDRLIIQDLVVQFGGGTVESRISDALARLPESASFELQRQVIRESF